MFTLYCSHVSVEFVGGLAPIWRQTPDNKIHGANMGPLWDPLILLSGATIMMRAVRQHMTQVFWCFVFSPSLGILTAQMMEFN